MVVMAVCGEDGHFLFVAVAADTVDELFCLQLVFQ